MNKLIILILLVILVSYNYLNRENFSINPKDFIPDYLEIQKHFRNDCIGNLYKCIKTNPYKSVYPFEKKYKDKKTINYTNTQLSSHLLPIKVNK